MKTLPVTLLGMMPALLFAYLIVAAVALTVGFFLYRKFKPTTKLPLKKELLLGGAVGVSAAALITLTFFGVQAYISSTNTTNVQHTAEQAGQSLTADEANRLMKDGAVETNGKTVLFSDDGDTYSVTVFDANENAAAQKAQDEKTKQQVNGTGGF